MSRCPAVILSPLLFWLVALPSNAQTDMSGDIKQSAVHGEHIQKGNVRSSAIRNDELRSQNPANADEYGSEDVRVGDTFTYASTATMTADVDRNPDAADDSTAVEEDGTVDIPVLGNDDRGDGPTTVVAVSDPPNGTASINPDGTVNYTPDPDFCGMDRFPYIIEDADGDQSTATVAVDVDCNPDAVDDTITTEEDTAITIDVLANDDLGDTPTTLTGFDAVNSDTGTANLTDATAPAPSERSADLTIDKIDRGETAIAGTNFTYQVQLTNNGPSDSSGWSIVDTLPEGMSLVSDPTDGDITTVDHGDGTATFSSDTDIATGNSRTFDVTVFVRADVSADAVLSNTVNASGQDADPTPGNNEDTEPTPIDRSADLTIGKIDRAETAIAGTNFSFQVRLTNNGPSNSSGWSVVDTLPAGISLVSGPADVDITTVDHVDGTVTFSSDTDIATGTSRTFDVTVFVDASVPGDAQLSNTVDVSE